MAASAIIQCYGLFWRREDVYWKASTNALLMGVPGNARTSEPTDFHEQIGIYVLYEGHQMIYVGQTGSGERKLYSRLKAHTKDSLAGRWDHFSWFGLRRPIGKGNLSTETIRASASISIALNHIEAVLIAASEPSLNKQGGRFGKNVRRFLQLRDERLGPTEQEMLRQLWKSRNGI